jgi:hypothetical protein
LEYGGLDRPVDVATAFTDGPLRAAYRDGVLSWP